MEYDIYSRTEGVVAVLLGVFFSTLSSTLREGLIFHSPSALFKKKKISGNQLAHTYSTIYVRIGTLWLSEL